MMLDELSRERLQAAYRHADRLGKCRILAALSVMCNGTRLSDKTRARLRLARVLWARRN